MSELRFNVAQLLQEHVGAFRSYAFEDPALDLGDGLWMKPVSGALRLMRTNDGVLAGADVSGAVEQECVRCLELFTQPIELEFEEEYFATVHVNTGAALPEPEGDDVFRINSAHLVDLGLAIREYALLALPIAPLCREDCQGIIEASAAHADAPDADDDSDAVDDRLAALKQLLK